VLEHLGRGRVRVRVAIAAILCALTALGPVVVQSNAAPAPAAVAAGLPIFSYAKTSATPLPWDATPRKPLMANTTMAGSPYVDFTAAGSTLLAWRTPRGFAMVNQTLASGVTKTICIQCLGKRLPLAASDPVVLGDAQDNLQTIFLSTTGRLVVITIWSDLDPGWEHFRGKPVTRAFVTARDLSTPAGVTFAATPSTMPVADGIALVGRTTTNRVVYMHVPLKWPLRITANDVRDITTMVNDGGVIGNPKWLPGTNTFIAADSTNHIMQYRLASDCILTPATCTAVTTQDITLAAAAPLTTPDLSLTMTPTGVALVGLTTTGVATLFRGTGSAGVYTWTDIDISTPSNAPSLADAPFVINSGATIFVAAKARYWGDLFIISNETGANTWKSVDVSITGGSDAQTVGGGIDGVVTPAGLVLYAGGVATPPPTGTGLYAIPQSKNSAAIADGWPSIGITGGLGTLSAPWVAVKSTNNEIRNSQDFLVGKAIAESHKRTAWLSYWTVSGPTSGEKVTADVYYAHAFAAGVAVANTIGKYRGLGLGLKPDWVIIDPEGYPDYHSCLDGVNTIAKWCPPWSPKLWTAYATGWAEGLTSVDATLKPAMYATQNEYKLGALSTLTMPVFLAVAFKWFSTSLTAPVTIGATSMTVASSSGLYAGQKIYFRDSAGPEFAQIASSYNGTNLTVPFTTPLRKAHANKVVVNGISPPVRLSTTKGNNLIGYIAFGSSNACLVAPWQIQLFNSAPWAGLYNSLQFDGGVYCRPSGN